LLVVLGQPLHEQLLVEHLVFDTGRRFLELALGLLLLAEHDDLLLCGRPVPQE